MMRSQIIADLLYDHECVIVPGLGGFLSSYLPASIDNETHRFLPPSCKIAFNESLSANDGILANHLSKLNGSTYKEALNEIRFWVDSSYSKMHSGERIKIDKVGYLYLNAENNLQFEPELRENFLGSSYGLPTFFAKAVSRGQSDNTEQLARIQGRPLRSKYLISETLKWAAVLAPFVAFILWGSLNPDRVSNYVQNYSGMFSWVRVTPDKTAPIPASTYKLASADLKKSTRIEAPASKLANSGEEFQPVIISNEALNQVKEDSQNFSGSNLFKGNAGEFRYFIIGGAFKEHANAIKLLNQLKSGGYPASIIDTNNRGMFIVSIMGFSQKAKAQEQLPLIKESGFSEAWILHK